MPVESKITLDTPEYAREGVWFDITGNVTPKAVRDVRLQVKRNGIWVTVDTQKTTATGAFSFPYTIANYSSFRVYTPRTDDYLYVESDSVPVKCLLFWDSFDKPTLGDAWTLRGTNYADGRQYSRSDWRAVEISDSKVHLKVIKDPDNPGKFLTGHIGTQTAFNFADGHAEAKVKFHRHKGAHSAFWLQGGYGPNAAEVDGAEFFGQGTRNFLHHTIWEDKNQDGELEETTAKVEDVDIIGSDRWWNSYHEVEVVWKPDYYTFKIDGKTTARFDMPTATVPAFVCLSLICKDWEFPDMKDPDNGGYVMSVEWVRVWR